MKKGRVFFHPIEGSGSLTISWSKAPKGDAIEAKKGSGVGFFSPRGELLCVIFDEVSTADQQLLQFAHHSIEVVTKNGRVEYKCLSPARVKQIARKRPTIQKRYNSSRKKISRK